MTEFEKAEPILVLERVRRLLYQALLHEDTELLDHLQADQLVYLVLEEKEEI